jgi:hypothetical protein
MAPIRVQDTVWCNRHGWEREIVPSSWITKEVSFNQPWIYRWTCPTCGQSRNRKLYGSNRLYYTEALALKAVQSHINAKHNGIVPYRRKRWSSDHTEDPRLFYS